MAVIALADTARLVASLELQDKFSGTASRFGSTLTGLERQTGTLGKIGGQIGRGVGTAVNNLKTIGLVAGGVLATQIQAGVASLNRLEEVTAQTEAVIKSTGGAAGLTSGDVRELAEEFENLNATMDDKVIQSGENLLLTFTSISEKAFKPALEAALDMNQAMGGGEEGLQSTIIQVGKALNDPIRGATALRRVGVQLTTQQEEQIKTLVEQNDLYGAQQIILEELSREFGGSFAAAGDTASAKFAKVHDAVEEAQQSLARAFLPVLGRVADKINTFLADPAVLARIESFGEGLAEGLEEAIDMAGEFASRIPWSTIGDSLKLAGDGARRILDAFLGLPSWVQTAVITGWGLNKLTGGALGQIAGTLGKAALGGFGQRGSTPANPLFVSAVGGGLGGAPVGGAGGKAGLGTRLLGAGLAVTGGAIIGSAIGDFINEEFLGVGEAREFETGQVEAVLASGDAGRIERAISVIEGQLDPNDFATATALALDVNGVRTTLEGQLEALEAQLDELGTTKEEIREARSESSAFASSTASQWSKEQASAYAQLNEQRATAVAARGAETAARQQERRLSVLEGLERDSIGVQRGILAKPSVFNADLTIHTSTIINASLIAERIEQQRATVGTGFQPGLA